MKLALFVACGIYLTNAGKSNGWQHNSVTAPADCTACTTMDECYPSGSTQFCNWCGSSCVDKSTSCGRQGGWSSGGDVTPSPTKTTTTTTTRVTPSPTRVTPAPTPYCEDSGPCSCYVGEDTCSTRSACVWQGGSTGYCCPVSTVSCYTLESAAACGEAGCYWGGKSCVRPSLCGVDQTPAPTMKITPAPTKLVVITPAPTTSGGGSTWTTSGSSGSTPTGRPTFKSAMKWEMIHPAYNGNAGELLWQIYYGEFSADARLDDFRARELWTVDGILPLLKSDKKFKRYSRRESEAYVMNGSTFGTEEISYTTYGLIAVVLLIAGFMFWCNKNNKQSKYTPIQ